MLVLPGRRPARDPIPVYLLIAGGQALLFSLTFTVNMVYQVTVVDLSPLQLVLVGTVLEATCFLFEIPTGIVADVYSRRRSILIGIGTIGCGFLVESIAHFWTVILAQVIWGIGYTFTSGATEAWITDEIGEEAVGHVFLRGTQAGLIGGIAGTLLSASLGLVAIRLPIVLAGIGMILLCLVLCVVMPEHHMHVTPPTERATFRYMRETFVAGLRIARRQEIVRTLILISFIVGLASEAFDRLNQDFVIGHVGFPRIFGTDSPVLWFGISSLVSTVLGLAASEVVKRRNPDALGAGVPARLLALCSAVQVIATAGFALSGNLWLAFAMLWLRTVVGAIVAPVEGAWLNRNLDSARRATVISMWGQANAIGQVAGGPVLGWVGSAISVRAALIGSALVLSPIVALYRRTIPRKDASGDLEVAAADIG